MQRTGVTMVSKLVADTIYRSSETIPPSSSSDLVMGGEFWKISEMPSMTYSHCLDDFFYLNLPH
jgi:hypothetical protein